MVLLFGGLHLIGLAFAGMLLVMFLRSDRSSPQHEGPDDESADGGGGGSHRRVPRAPQSPGGDGLPLPDAAPARRRMREPGRLGEDERPTRRRRDPMHVPVPGRRTPARG
jgi:hypothetical protein